MKWLEKEGLCWVGMGMSRVGDVDISRRAENPRLGLAVLFPNPSSHQSRGDRRRER